MRVKVEEIRKISEEILMKAGVPAEHAAIVADTIVYAHIRGKHTHGLGRVSIYLRKIKENLMAADTPLEVLNDTGAIYHVDAHHGFGQVAAYYAMEEAIKKAGEYGVGFASVKDSNNFGTAGYFAKLASDHHMVGLVFGNSAPAIAPAGGDKALFGTNPLSMSFPLEDEDCPFIFDMATSMAARGKIRLAAKNGEPIPEGWALDENGNPTTDAEAALKGSMIPIGGYKGVGLSMMVDVLAGMLSGAAFAGDVKGLNHKTDLSRYGHALIAIDVKKFMDWEEYIRRAEYFRTRVHECGGELPGEGSYRKAVENAETVEIPDKQAAEINALAEEYQLELRLS